MLVGAGWWREGGGEGVIDRSERLEVYGWSGLGT